MGAVAPKVPLAGTMPLPVPSARRSMRKHARRSAIASVAPLQHSCNKPPTTGTSRDLPKNGQLRQIVSPGASARRPAKAAPSRTSPAVCSSPKKTDATKHHVFFAKQRNTIEGGAARDCHPGHDLGQQCRCLQAVLRIRLRLDPGAALWRCALAGQRRAM